MFLYEHRDFKQAILQASVHFQDRGFKPSMIEKDYYVTEVLRRISWHGGKTIIFKGGTSLSKGWNLIERFSEDVDVFLNPKSFDPSLGGNGINRELRKVKDAVSSFTGVEYLPEESQTFGGFGRNDRFVYSQFFGGIGEISNRVLVELGTASGTYPTEIVKLESYLAQFLRERRHSLDCTDESGFEMPLLHFRRTFVEKLFAIHGKVQKFLREGQPIGKYARHYYDLYQLSLKPEVTAMLQSEEYEEIKKDYERVSLDHFPRDYCRPEGMRFFSSEAIFPSSSFAPKLQQCYEKECSVLCYGAYPSWETLLKRFQEIRAIL